MENINVGAHFLFLPILCSMKIERLLFLKFLKNLAFFDSYFWPFNKSHEKTNAIFVISAIMASIWNVLSGGFWARPPQSKVVKIKSFDFSYWAWSTPWGHVLSLKTFCRNPVLSWAIRYSVFQPVKFSSSLEFVCGNPFSTFWHLMVNFG